MALTGGEDYSGYKRQPHHDLRNCALADRFIPERWLDAAKQQDQIAPLDAAKGGATTFATSQVIVGQRYASSWRLWF